MPKGTKVTNVEKREYLRYKSIADGFYEAAKDELNSKRWNAVGLLIVHSAIGYADAVAIKESGQKSSSENHQDSVKLLEKVVKHTESRNSALNQLERLIGHKTTVAYSGEQYDQADIEKLMKHLERFRTWVLKLLEYEL